MLDVAYTHQLIQSYAPIDADDAQFKQKFLSFLSHVDEFGIAPEGRLTGAAWVVDPAAEKILLLYNNFLKLWMNPGGKYETGDKRPERTAARELAEEAGIYLEARTLTLFDIDIIDTIYNPNLKTDFYDMRFLAVVDSTKTTPTNDSRWFTMADARTHLLNDVRNRRLLQRTQLLFN